MGKVPGGEIAALAVKYGPVWASIKIDNLVLTGGLDPAIRIGPG